MSDLGFSDDLAFSSDSLASNRLSPAPPGRRRTRTGTSNTRGGSDGSVDSSSTKSGLMATSTPSRSTRERRREKPRGKGILHVDKDIADSRSSSASSSAREKSRTRHGDADQSPPHLRGLGKPENNEEETYEEMFGAVERQQRAEEASSSLGVSGQSNFTLGMSLQSESLAISEGMLNPDGRVSRQETAQFKPPRAPVPGGVFNESLSKETGWAGDLSSPSTAANNKRRSLQQFARSSSPGGRAQSTSGRLSVFDDLLESKRDSMFSVGSSMRGDIEKTFGNMAPMGRARGEGPFDLGGRFNARNRFIYYGMDYMYSSMDDVFSVTHWDAPRDLSRKKHIPSKPYSYPIHDISFTMADLAKFRWKAKPCSYRPSGPFASPEELLAKLGETSEYSYTKVELLPKDTFTKMQWKRPPHHHFQHRFYKRGFFHDTKWQDRVLFPPPTSPTPRRPLHTLGVGSPAYGKGTIVYLPRHREVMLLEESLSYCITMQHLHRFEAACVSSFELIMKQERAGRRVIKKSMNRFVSMHIDTMLKSLAETEAINRQQIEDEILGVDSLALLQVVVSEGIMRFVFACEEEEYLAGLGRLRDVSVNEVLAVEQDRRDEFTETTRATSAREEAKHVSGGGEVEEEEEEWMRGGKYERYLIGAARRMRKETPTLGQYYYSSATSTAPRVASPLNDNHHRETTATSPLPSSISRVIKFAFSPSDDSKSQFWARPSSGKEQQQQSATTATSNDDDVHRCNLMNPCDSNIKSDFDNINHHHCINYDIPDDGVEERECIPSQSTAATSDADSGGDPTNTLRVRPTRYPRRPASSAGKSNQRPAAASSSALAATLNTFINNQWALPKSNLRSPLLVSHSSPPTHQAITNEPHHHHQLTITVDGAEDDRKDTVLLLSSRPTTATTTTNPQHNYRPVTSSPPPPPKRVPLPSSLQRRGTAPQLISTPCTSTMTTSGASSRPLLIGRASSPISDQTRQNASASSALPLSPHQPAAPTRPQTAFTFVEMRKMRAKLNRFDEAVYTGPMHQRSTPPMGM